MMLNSKSNNKRLLLGLVCGAMSYSTFAQVYSWRDADGAMHYSQFPRQIVEKNAAQSRASRKQADINDVVNDLASTKKRDNLLDGLDDIVANAHVERQIEKVLTRRDPQLVLIEQQLARQQAEQHARLIAKQHVVKEQISKEQLALVAGTQITATEITATEINSAKVKQPRKSANKFLADIQNKLKRQQVVTRPQSVSVVEPSNAFLAAIKRKLNRKQVTEAVHEPVILAQKSKPVIKSKTRVVSKLQVSSEQVQDKFLAEINKKLFRPHLTTDNSGADNPPVAELVKSSSALMLSRLSYNQQARLPLLGTGINQLDIQGIDASSQFVNDVNRNAE